ncbi:MAG: hypothetical protein VXX55_08850, partial [Planctomycetota bacterium]|nr:hypothetical protein [Planctomycetota bacterium]
LAAHWLAVAMNWCERPFQNLELRETMDEEIAQSHPCERRGLRSTSVHRPWGRIRLSRIFGLC